MKRENIKIALGLVLGLAIIIWMNPPRTPCQAQIDLYQSSIKKMGKSFTSNLQRCKEHPEVGGCVAILDIIGKLSTKLGEFPPQCSEELAKDQSTRAWLMTSMELITKLAWGSQAPQSYLYRNNWLEPTHVALFCHLKNQLTQLYGDGGWSSFVDNMLTDMPGATALGRNEAWGRSILSEPCK